MTTPAIETTDDGTMLTFRLAAHPGEKIPASTIASFLKNAVGLVEAIYKEHGVPIKLNITDAKMVDDGLDDVILRIRHPKKPAHATGPAPTGGDDPDHL